VANRGRGQTLLFFRGLQKLFELFGADAFLRIGAPLDARCPDRTGVEVATFLAGRLRLIGPDLDLLAAFLAPDVLRLWLAYLYASGATFFKHDSILRLSKQEGYDLGHTATGFYPSRASFTESVISILKLYGMIARLTSTGMKRLIAFPFSPAAVFSSNRGRTL
jgi:hypothetical protein